MTAIFARLAAGAALLLVPACSGPAGDSASNATDANAIAAESIDANATDANASHTDANDANAMAAPAGTATVGAETPPPAARAVPATPAAPGTPQGLPDDRRPISEKPFAATSAQGAADVVQTYYALVEAGRVEAARRLWRGGREAAAADLARYAEQHAQVGAPGQIEGAAGSLFVTVPVSLYGRLKDGTAFRKAATVTLRRVNDVPGSTAEQRLWRIERIEAGRSGG